MIFFVGQAGSGKTTLLRAFVRRAAAKGRVYVLDTEREFDGDVVPHGVRQFPIARVGRPVVYRPRATGRTPLMQSCFEAFARHVNRRGGVLVCDEVGRMRGPRVDALAGEDVGRIATGGRHYPRASGMFASQRFIHFWSECRTDARIIYAFRQFSALDVDALCDSVPIAARDTIRQVCPSLPDLQYVRVDMKRPDLLDLRVRTVDVRGRKRR